MVRHMSIQRHWRLLSGGALLLWQIGLSVLDVAGRADFIIQHASEPGWLAVIANGLLYPSSFLTVPAIALGLGLIWLDSKR